MKWSKCLSPPAHSPVRGINLARLPLIGRFVGFVNASPDTLLAAKCLSVAVFLLVVVAGLFGTPYPERNLATMLVFIGAITAMNLWVMAQDMEMRF